MYSTVNFKDSETRIKDFIKENKLYILENHDYPM